MPRRSASSSGQRRGARHPQGRGTSFDQAGPSLGAILKALNVPAGALLGNGFTGNLRIGDDFSILVQALGTSTRANLLSTPQVTVLDNVAGEFVSGQNVPFVTGSILTNSSNGHALHHDRAQGCRHHAARPAADQCGRHDPAAGQPGSLVDRHRRRRQPRRI
jgi:hypothetical protein